MATGRRTDWAKVALIRVLDEAGFDRTFITQTTGVPQRTANEIINRRGSWSGCDEVTKELYAMTRLRVSKGILDHADELALHCLKAIESKIDRDNYWQNIGLLSMLVDLEVKLSSRDGG